MQRVKKSFSMFETPPKIDHKKEDKQLWLPDHLSGKILDLQFECQTENLSREVIDKLVECYSKAVEFYNERGNYKYKIYQRRMQMFLAKPKIEQILKGKTAKMIMAKQQTQQQLKHAQFNSKKAVQQIISQSEKTTQEAFQKMKKNLQKQQDKLEERIRKKRTMSNKSTKTEDNKDDEFGRGNIGEKMSMKLLLDGINQRHKKVFF